ncbi:MAG: peptidase S1 and S6 chymotrypsin/Hap, partial [Chloroflexi bacterium OLB15]
AVGHPWGVHNAATGGVIIGRSPALPDMPRIRNDWIVADLHLRPGNSGGPMVNTRGQLVGVNTMITGPSVGIAVSVEAVKDFLQQTIGRAAVPSTVTV